jgi:hypothetical protein
MKHTEKLMYLYKTTSLPQNSTEPRNLYETYITNTLSWVIHGGLTQGSLSFTNITFIPVTPDWVTVKPRVTSLQLNVLKTQNSILFSNSCNIDYNVEYLKVTTAKTWKPAWHNIRVMEVLFSVDLNSDSFEYSYFLLCPLLVWSYAILNSSPQRFWDSYVYELYDVTELEWDPRIFCYD